jgi:hypothetical protein
LSDFRRQIQCKHQGVFDSNHDFRRQLAEPAMQSWSRQRTETLDIRNGAPVKKSESR